MAVVDIIERSVSGSGGLYVRVHAWADQAAKDARIRPHIESFHFANPQLTKQEPTVNAHTGEWLNKDGTWIKPEDVLNAKDREGLVLTEVPVDVKDRVSESIRRWASTTTITPGQDDSDTTYFRSTQAVDDPKGLLIASMGLVIS